MKTTAVLDKNEEGHYVWRVQDSTLLVNAYTIRCTKIGTKIIIEEPDE